MDRKQLHDDGKIRRPLLRKGLLKTFAAEARVLGDLGLLLAEEGAEAELEWTDVAVFGIRDYLLAMTLPTTLAV